MTTTPNPPTPPGPFRIEKHKCGMGNPLCGEPARLYPCGWRCDEHQPSRMREATQ